jgi:peptidoglycan hydrolase-like protein with peptidoglycan-binding domain
MANTDRQRVMRHKEKFIVAAQRFHLPPALLGAIASRESRGGNVLDHNGEGDRGNGFGLMQVDKRSHTVRRDGGPFGQPHIDQATGILKDKLESAGRRFPALSDVEKLELAVSTYNGGKGLPPPRSDEKTTGGDYMNDVWARAQFYARVEDWSTPRPIATAQPVGLGVPSNAAVAAGAASAATAPAVATAFTAAPSLAEVRAGNAVLQVGQAGEAVQLVQQLLCLSADQKYGRNTKSAVTFFQRLHNMAIPTGNEGKVDSETLARIEELYSADLAAVAPINPRGKADTVHPEFRKRLGQLAGILIQNGLMAMITDGFRSFEEQHKIFLIGRRGIPGERVVTGADAGSSNHNYGLAVDMYPVIQGQVFTKIPAGASASFKKQFNNTQQTIIEKSEQIGLFSGIHFTNLQDTPHVQLFAENILKPRSCLKIFTDNNQDLNAVWAEASRLLALP